MCGLASARKTLLLITIGWIYRRRGAERSALPELRTALALYPRNVKFRITIALGRASRNSPSRFDDSLSRVVRFYGRMLLYGRTTTLTLWCQLSTSRRTGQTTVNASQSVAII